MSNKKRKKHIKSEIDEAIEINNFKNIKLNIKDFKLTEKQRHIVQTAFDKNTKIIFINGPAGSAKSFISVYCALHLFNTGQHSEIKYIRTIAESGERALGALPGTVDEKFNPFMIPLYDKLDELIPINQTKYLEQHKLIEALPVNFLRGATWKDMIILMDECQNFSTKELITAITRIGENTKIFICGDSMQSDVGNKSGFMKIYDLFHNEESRDKGIFCFEFTEEDIMRSEILKFIVHQFKKLEKLNHH